MNNQEVLITWPSPIKTRMIGRYVRKTKRVHHIKLEGLRTIRLNSQIIEVRVSATCCNTHHDIFQLKLSKILKACVPNLHRAELSHDGFEKCLRLFIDEHDQLRVGLGVVQNILQKCMPIDKTIYRHHRIHKKSLIA